MSNFKTTNTCLFLDVLHIKHDIAVKATAFATTTIGCIAAIGAVIGNALVLLIFIKFARLRTPSNLLIGSLCVSDILTGLIVIPLSAVRRIGESYDRHNCNVRLVCAFFAFLCLATSVVTVGEISIDRLYAIAMPFRYQRRANNVRYALLISISWLVLSLFALLPFLRVIKTTTFFIGLFTLMGISIVAFLASYAKISRIVQSHHRKLLPVRQNTIVSQDSRMSAGTMVMRERKKANTIAIVISFALVSYVPLAMMFILRGVIGDTIALVSIADPWADLFVHVNSMINPIIYCLRTREIRDPIIRILPDQISTIFVRTVGPKPSIPTT